MTTNQQTKAIFLDLDGTLANSLPTMYSAYDIFLKRFEKTPSYKEFQALNGPPLLEVIRYLKQAHELLERETILEQYYCRILDEIYHTSEPCLGAEELLLNAKLDHCLIGVVTSNTRARTENWLNHVKLSPMIDFIISSNEVSQGKPDPEPYIKASKIATCHLSEMIAIEDSFLGAKSAVGAGLRTFVIQTEQTSYFEFPKVEYIKSLEHVTKKIFKNNQKFSITQR